MKPKRHPCARTTPIDRQVIQESRESQHALAARLHVNRKTVAKWQGRSTTRDEPRGPRTPPHSHSLDEVEEAFVVHYRLATGLTLDDCVARLQDAFPKLTRSSLHRCLKRHGVGRLRRGLIPVHRTRAARFGEGYFWITVHRSHNDPSLSPLFAAIERGSGRCFLRRPTASDFDAGRFLDQLVRSNAVKAVTTPDEPPFRDPRDRLRSVPIATSFVRACQRNCVTHWPGLPDMKSRLAAAKPRRRRRMRRPRKATD